MKIVFIHQRVESLSQVSLLHTGDGDRGRGQVSPQVMVWTSPQVMRGDGDTCPHRWRPLALARIQETVELLFNTFHEIQELCHTEDGF